MTAPLADRVENASGADRSLDLAIFREIGAPVGNMRVRYEPPAYTGSLDAAMSLVPEGWGWLVSQPSEKAIASGLLKQDTPVLGEVQYGCGQRYAVAAATPALALVAAALRAHHKDQTNG